MKKEDIKKLSESELIKLVRQVRAKKQELKEKIKSADERAAKIVFFAVLMKPMF